MPVRHMLGHVLKHVPRHMLEHVPDRHVPRHLNNRDVGWHIDSAQPAPRWALPFANTVGLHRRSGIDLDGDCQVQIIS